MSYTSQTLTDLEKEHQAAINAAQERMLTELNDAQVSGNLEKIQEASVVFQNVTTELATEYTAKIEEINALNHKATIAGEPEIYTNKRADIDLNLLVYDGDRDYVIAFQQDELIQKTLEKVNQNSGKFKSRKHLLKSSLRLTKTLAPMLH